MANSRCGRCGGLHMLIRTEPIPGLIVIQCARCRRKAQEENEAGQARSTGKDDPADYPDSGA